MTMRITLITPPAHRCEEDCPARAACDLSHCIGVCECDTTCGRPGAENCRVAKGGSLAAPEDP